MALDYLLTSGPHDPKHQTLTHSIVSYTTMLILLTSLNLLLSESSNYYPTTKQLILAFILFTYTLILFTSRVVTDKQVVIYEMFWQCNVGLVLATIGAAIGKHDIVGAAVASIALDQSMWWVDITSYAFVGKFIVGVAKYITWPETSWTRVFTASHHLWFIPLCAVMNDGLPWSSLYIAVANVAFMAVITRITIPFEMPFQGKIKYMNVNCTYECWKDVKIWVLHLADRKK